MTKLQKNNKDIYYHNLIQRLQKTSAIVSHIVGLEDITGDITQIPIINEWYNQMNDGLSFNFQNLINAIHELDNLTGEPEIIEIGEITFNDLNSASLGATEINVVFTDKKPADKYITDIFFKNTSAFVATNYYGYPSNTISDIFIKKNINEPSIGTSGIKLPQQITEDVTIQVVISEDNEQDWVSGSLKVYASVKTYPTLQ